ncbi:hypothetical protein N8837_04255 [Pseudomonadales bacterium]|nr:hypothetical protein [Pseudomonadales bacterium]
MREVLYVMMVGVTGLNKEPCSGYGVADARARNIDFKKILGAEKIGFRSRFRAGCRKAAFKKGTAVNREGGPNLGPVFESAPGYALALRGFAH